MKWTKESKKFALKLFKSGKSFLEISKILGTTRGSIRNCINRLGYKETDFYKKEYKIIKKCLKCNVEFTSLISRKMKFCSLSCSAALTNTLKVKKNSKKCLNCEKELLRRDNKYCNNSCSTKHRQKIRFKEIETGSLKYYERWYKDYLIEKYGNKCMECGWCEIHPITNKVPVQLEHIDGNATNNELTNLKLLCPNCHSLTPTFGALNKGYGRKNRYKNNI